MSRAPADRALPALRELLPDTGAPELVSEAVRELAEVDLQGPNELRYVRYHPGRNCIALWSLGAADGRPLLVSATLFAGDRGGALVADDAYRELAAEASALARVRCGYRYLPDRRLLVQLFPLDPSLRTLPAAASPERVGRALAAEAALDGRTVAAEPALLSYKPWRRCVLRYPFQDVEGGGAYIGKVYRDDRGEAVFTRLELVRSELSAARAPWSTVAPAAYLPEIRLLLLEGVRGAVGLRRLFEPAVDDPDVREALLEHMHRAAAGLLRFRNVHVPGLAHVTPDSVLTRLEDRRRSLESVLPDFADAAARCVRRLEEELPRLQAESPCLAHGAFRHNQLLLAGDGLVVADLDTLRRAGAGTDAGEFLACLDRIAVRRPHLQGVIARCAEMFVAGLETEDPPSPSWIAWHRASSHVKLALRSVLSLAPDWPETAYALLRLSRSTLAAGVPRAGVRVR